MTTPQRVFSVSVAAILFSTAIGATVAAQQFVTKQPTAADWAALAKLPDFNGVWERGAAPRGNAPAAAPAAPRGAAAPPAAAAAGRGGAGGRGGGGRGGGVQLTPEYEAKRAAYKAPEDSETANCLPPTMPGIMTQPYPMEFLITPGK